MNTIKRYWILEIVLFVIAITAFGFFLNDTVNARSGETISVESSPAIVEAIESVPAINQEVDEDELDLADEDFDAEDEATDLEDEPETVTESDFEEGEGDEFYILDAAAQYLQVDVEQIESAVASGLSLAEIATRLDANVQAMTDALVAQELASIDRIAQAENLSAEEVADWREEAQIMTPFFIQTVYYEPELVVAQTLGLDVETMFERAERGETLEAIAQSKGIDVQALVDAVIASEHKLIDDMQAADLVDADEAQEWKEEVASEAPQWVTGMFLEDEGMEEEDSEA